MIFLRVSRGLISTPRTLPGRQQVVRREYNSDGIPSPSTDGIPCYRLRSTRASSGKVKMSRMVIRTRLLRFSTSAPDRRTGLSVSKAQGRWWSRPASSVVCVQRGFPALYDTFSVPPPSPVFCFFLCYFTFLHLVSYLTINQQFGREATGNHSDQRLVMSENGQAF